MCLLMYEAAGWMDGVVGVCGSRFHSDISDKCKRSIMFDLF